MRLVDLTLPLDERCTLPGHPPFTIAPIHAHQMHGRSNSSFSGSLHAGTHVDSPYHFHPDGVTIERVPLDRVIGPGVLLDLRDATRPRTAITREDLSAAAGELLQRLAGRIPVLFTNWTAAKFFDSDYYAANPYLEPEAAQWLVEQQPRSVCIDAPVDPPTPGGPRPGDGPVHRKLLGAGIPIIEHVVNLEQLLGRSFWLFAAPLPVRGGDGAPCRAVAILDSPFG